ncbi:MAG: FAD-binding protein [Alphaproteobacteria bacterium]|nr:FAD-binding protein [Alphaproteobacteria bacterium]
MNAPHMFPVRPGDPALARRLAKEIEGEVLFDAFSRGRYATDASIYQIEPLGVVIPKTRQDIVRTLEIARDAGVPVLPRGGGTSQCGQTVGEAIVIDCSKYLNRVVSVDAEAGTAVVEPGITLDGLNKQLKSTGLWYPVDISTGSRATLGGMTANNSCGSRSFKYGIMRDNVAAIDAFLADGSAVRFGEENTAGLLTRNDDGPESRIFRELLRIGEREADEIRTRFPDVMRRVGGYNIDALMPADRINLAHILIGSEGTLAVTDRVHLKLSPQPKEKVLGICHFPTFYQAMDATQHLVKLNPTTAELVDRTMIDLAREIPMFRETVNRFVKGEPDALLLVEFADDDPQENLRLLDALEGVMADLGFEGGVVRAEDKAFQSAVWEVRKQGLNIMMSMKGDGKPVSFVEDCAVRLEHLADYTDRLTKVFEKHGTTGTWYAHAAVGTLHVRPILNMKTEDGAKKMRAIAEEAFEMVKEYKGAHSGEHGDGLVRSEFHEEMYGKRVVDSFGDVKTLMDPEGRLNPGKIVNPPKMDDRTLMRFKPGYETEKSETVFDWSAWGGFPGAVEMCNNNGACRKRDAGVMCPSYRATGDEKDVVRGRANSLRLALSGQLGPDAVTSDSMADTLKLCVSCKACRSECPTGVDMAKMKLEVLAKRAEKYGLSRRERLVADLPRMAKTASKMGGVLNALNRMPGAGMVREKMFGLAADRLPPDWAAKPFAQDGEVIGPETGTPVVLLVDTFSRYFDADQTADAIRLLSAAGCRVHLPALPRDGRPVCCGRTYLAAGLPDRAKAEAERTLDVLKPYLDQDMPILGLEPSCHLGYRDEIPGLVRNDLSAKLATSSKLVIEYLADELEAGRLSLSLKSLGKPILIHGHCHEKSYGPAKKLVPLLSRIPGSEVKMIDSSCCGMAGAFGYQAETADVSRRMGELSLAPAIREADKDTILVADGTSCRHQIADLTKRGAKHAVSILAEAIDG